MAKTGKGRQRAKAAKKPAKATKPARKAPAKKPLKAAEPAPGQAKRPRGGQTTYTQAVADQICALLAAGWTLRQVCREPSMPPAPTVRGWVLANKRFAEQYGRARESGYRDMADELIDIADDGSNDWMDRELRNGEKIRVVDEECVKRSTLRVDTRKWLLAKALPKVYGDKATVEHTGDGFRTFLEAVRGGKFKPRAYDPNEDDDV
jgi:hypothetical protein